MTGVLLKAVTAGRPRQVRLLLDSGIPLETSDDCGQTPLIRSVFLDHRATRARIMRLLLKAGARVSKPDCVGRNALVWACVYARDREVKWLLSYADVDLDLNVPDYKGQTALFHAVTTGNAAIVKLVTEGLSKYGLSTEVPDRRGVTPLMQGIRLGHDVCCSILIQQGGATLGQTLMTPEDVDRAIDMWADSYTERYGGSDSPDAECEPIGARAAKAYFPPIISQYCANKIRLQEQQARLYSVHTPESPSGRDSCCFTDDKPVMFPDLGPSLGWTATAAPSHQLVAAPAHFTPQTQSLTSSTEANVDTSDDEVDDRSRPVHPATGGYQAGGRDLPRMYHIYEQQKSPSYRPGAARPVVRPEPEGGSSTDASPGSSTDSLNDTLIADSNNINTGNNGGKSTKLPKSRGRRTLTRTRVGGSRIHSPDGAPFHSSSDSDISEKLFIPTRKNVLPQIHKERGFNYSNM